MKQYLEKHYPQVAFHCPQLANVPEQAIGQLTDMINQHADDYWLLVGSSLGGYFATYLSEQYQLRAVLINPAIKPYELLADYLGQQQNPYTGEQFWVTQAHMQQLKLLERAKITEKNYLVMVQMGDEVLDYRLAQEKFSQANLIVQPDGDHSFINFEQMLPTVAQFLHLSVNTKL